MLTARYFRHDLSFIKPAGTSRGVLYEKPSWFLVLSNGSHTGVGECSVIPGLSPDDVDSIEHKLSDLCVQINNLNKLDFDVFFTSFPALRFALEMALKDLENKSDFLIYKSPFSSGEEAIQINGLIWMGDRERMLEQISDKLKQGFACIKLKIGAINWDDEKSLLEFIRTNYGKDQIELRVDANGAFSAEKAPEILKVLADLDIHSIEQPIKAGQWNKMAALCGETPCPIALDEELIGIENKSEKIALLNTIKPQYIILKPSLVGGFKHSEEWITLAEERGIAWWATSALESNVGLSAIAQWTAILKNDMPQGLGTGALFHNNIDSPLFLKGDQLYYGQGIWDTKIFEHAED